MPWKSLLAGAALLTAVLVGLGFFWPFGRNSDRLVLPGVVEIQEVRLGSKIGGRVAEIGTAEGEIVTPGQLLVRFEVPELEAQKAQWEAQLAMMEAEYEKAKNGPRIEEIRQAEADLVAAQADLKFAREDMARVERIFRQGGADRTQLDNARAARDRAQGRADSARAKVDLLHAGTRVEEVAEAQAHVLEMRGKLRELDANLREAEVRAPEKAVVDVLAVRKGDLVTPNQPIVRVLRDDDLWVRIYVPETELHRVQLHQKGRVRIDGVANRWYDGEVFKIDPESQYTPRNVQSPDERRYQVFGVKVRVIGSQGVLKSGMYAEVTFDFSAEPPPDTP
jgi:multidrug resistance efflux pump